MSLLTKYLNQTAVYWPTPSKDWEGKLTFGTAIEITCRWKDVNDLFLNREGKEEISQAVVHVGQDVELDGYLYLGNLTDLSAGELLNPVLEENAHPIKSFKKNPSIKGDDFVRKAWL